MKPYAKPAAKPMMNKAETSLGDTASEYGAKGLQLAAAAALFAFDTKWLFYVLAIILLYLTLRTMKRWVSRPRF